MGFLAAFLVCGVGFCSVAGSGETEKPDEEMKRFLSVGPEEIDVAQRQLQQLEQLVAFFSLPASDRLVLEGKVYDLEEFAKNSDQLETDSSLAIVVRTFCAGRILAERAEKRNGAPRGAPSTKLATAEAKAPILEYSQLNPAPLADVFREVRRNAAPDLSAQGQSQRPSEQGNGTRVLFQREIATYLALAYLAKRHEHVLLAEAIWWHCFPGAEELREPLSQVWERAASARAEDAEKEFEKIRVQTGVGSVGRTPLFDRVMAKDDWRERLAGVTLSAGEMAAAAGQELEKMSANESRILRLIEQRKIRQALESLRRLYAKSRGLIRTRAFSAAYRVRLREFLQKAEQLEIAEKAGRSEEARELIRQMQQTAADFEASRHLATLGEKEDQIRRHLEGAKKAVLDSDREKFNAEIRQAAELAPENGQVALRIARLKTEMEGQEKRLQELEELIRVWDVKKIYQWQRDRVRLADPGQQARVEEALREYQEREAAIDLVRRIAREPGMTAMAWDEAEKRLRKNRNQPELVDLQKELELEVSSYVRTLRMAETKEREGDLGAAFSLFLRAKQDWPGSELANEGLGRVRSLLSSP